MTSFTGSSNVSSSHVGASAHPLLVPQLAPAGCASLALAAVVHGSGTFSNGQHNTLVLGSAGADTITDTGAGNCIVGGGGANTITGTSTDVCVSGATLNTAGPCPVAGTTTTTTTSTTVPPSHNGVTVTHSSDNYNNYGGQERLVISNPSSITAMRVTVDVALTAGVTFNSQANSYPGGAITESEATSGNFLVFTFLLTSGQTIAAGSSGTLYSEYNGTGSAHAMSGDTWSVTTTSGGIASTLTGTF